MTSIAVYWWQKSGGIL